MGSAPSKSSLHEPQQETAQTSGPSRPNKNNEDGKPRRRNSSSLSGVDLVNYKCRRKHKAYKKCISSWYAEEFLPGKITTSQEEKCGHIFEAYRECYLKGIQKEVWEKKGLPPPKEGSILADFIEYNKEDEPE